MIKAIAFDFGGVLAHEKEIELSETEDRMERFFGKLDSDEEYLDKVQEIVPDREQAEEIAKGIVHKLYEAKDATIFSKVKQTYPGMKICVATNHVTWIEDVILEMFPEQEIDKIFVSAKMHKSKPDEAFYLEVAEEMELSPSEILFLDDRMENVVAAQNVQMKAFQVTRPMNLWEEICQFLRDNV